MLPPAPVLAHSSGWDEFLVLLSPIAIFAALRLIERRRASTQKPGTDAPVTDEHDAPA